MSKLFVEDTSLFAIGDAIREKTGKEDLLTLEQMPEEIRGISSGSGGGEVDNGLDLFPYVRYVDFTAGLQEVTEDITLHLERATSINGMFAQVSIINAPKITVYISDACVNINAFVRGSVGKQEVLKIVKIVGDTKHIKDFSFAFYWRVSLETIDCEFDFSSATNVNSMLTYCYALKDVRFKPNTLSLSISIAHSPLLSAESRQSIVDGLADLTDSTTQTITFHKDVKAKLTDTQIATITNKNWTLA